MPSHHADLRIAFQAGDDQIRGHVARDGHEPRAFNGWLALIAAIDGLLADGGGEAALPPRAAAGRVGSTTEGGGSDRADPSL